MAVYAGFVKQLPVLCNFVAMALTITKIIAKY